MLNEGDTWTLYDGDRPAADLVVYEVDQPWVSAHVRWHEGAGRFAELFEDEWRESEAENWDRADELYEQIRAQLRLTYPDGRDVPEFLLHITGDEAWWRWSDEPFEET